MAASLQPWQRTWKRDTIEFDEDKRTVRYWEHGSTIPTHLTLEPLKPPAWKDSHTQNVHDVSETYKVHKLVHICPYSEFHFGGFSDLPHQYLWIPLVQTWVCANGLFLEQLARCKSRRGSLRAPTGLELHRGPSAKVWGPSGQCLHIAVNSRKSSVHIWIYLISSYVRVFYIFWLLCGSLMPSVHIWENVASLVEPQLVKLRYCTAQVHWGLGSIPWPLRSLTWNSNMRSKRTDEFDTTTSLLGDCKL